MPQALWISSLNLNLAACTPNLPSALACPTGYRPRITCRICASRAASVHQGHGSSQPCGLYVPNPKATSYRPISCRCTWHYPVSGWTDRTRKRTSERGEICIAMQKHGPGHTRRNAGARLTHGSSSASCSASQSPNDPAATQLADPRQASAKGASKRLSSPTLRTLCGPSRPRQERELRLPSPHAAACASTSDAFCTPHACARENALELLGLHC